MRHRKGLLYFGILLVVAALIAAGCDSPFRTTAQGASSETASASETGNGVVGTVTVTIKDFKFEPESLTIPPGTRVVFVNEDPTPHNVVEGTASQVAQRNHKPLFESPEFGQGESWEIVFDEVGQYDYACTVAGHYLMGMVGTINVVEGADLSNVASSLAASAQDGAAEAHAHHTVSVSAENLPEGMTLLPEGMVEVAPFRVDGNVKEFHIDVQEVTHELIDGVEVTAWAFNGTVPGTLLRVTEGDLVRVHFTNTHHQPHTIHWHGIYTDVAYDGVPHTSKAVMPGETYVYEFVAENPGTYMYHCHVDSYRHIDLGMYGALIIEPKGPKTWDNEYVMILDDWDSNVNPLEGRFEPEHNHFLINGRAFPALPMLPLKVGETTRVRLINAGYNNFAMHLHGPNFKVVASDGHPLPYPYTKDTLDIAPGERYDIEITPSKAGMYPFHAHNIQYVRNDGLYPGGMHLMFDIVE